MKKILSILALLSFFSIDSSAFTKYVTTNISLRYEPNAKSYCMTVIPKGTAVTIDEDCDCEWVPVEYNGFIGYISTQHLSNKSVGKKSKYSRKAKHRTSRTSKRKRKINKRPYGATALCNDGTYSYSQTRRGTCSHHGGVAIWF